MSASPRRYGQLTVYGPFKRLVSETQTSAVVLDVLRSGELWGRAARFSDVPSVKAYVGQLRDGERGFEFFALAPPESPYGGTVFWRERADGRVWAEGPWARMNVVVSRVDQDL